MEELNWHKLWVGIAFAAALPLTALAIMLNWPMSEAEAQYRAQLAEDRTAIAEVMASEGYAAGEIAVVITALDIPGDKVNRMTVPVLDRNTENEEE